MSTVKTTTMRTAGVALKMLLTSVLVLGLLYTVVFTGIALLFLPRQADGSFIYNEQRQVLGSSLIGQSYQDADGNALPQYFQPRPSAAGDGYDPMASGGSNLGPNNPDLEAMIAERQQRIITLEDATAAEIPPDAVTASGSGLDPHISTENAHLQAERVAANRDVPVEKIRSMIESETEEPLLGFIGQSSVNVVKLNILLDQIGN